MKRTSLRILALCALAFPFAAIPSAVRAQDALPDDIDMLLEEDAPIVRAIDVRYVGPQTIDRARILGMLSTRVGSPLSIDATDQDLRTLITSGDVDNARILTEKMAGGVRVIVEVSTRAALAGLFFEGNESIPARKVASEVPLTVGETLSELKLLEGKRNIEKLYNGRGFSDVGVEYRINRTDREGFQSVTYVIREGERNWVRKIRIEGTDAVKPSEVVKTLDTRPESWITWLTRSNQLDSLRLQSDIAKVGRAVQDQGYMRARVVDVRRDRVGDKKVDLVFVVEQGPFFTVNDVKVSGMKVFEPGQIAREFEQLANSPYNATAIAEDEKLIRDYYGSEGYADARVETIVTPAGEGRVDIEYRVTEGGRYFVGQVNIRGNEVSKDKVVRREITLAPGDVFNTVEVDTSRRRLMGTGYFSQVDMFPTEGMESGYRDLNVSVSEKLTGSLVFGVGFSSIDNLVGYVNVTQTNFDARNWPRFTGGGQKFSLAARLGTETTDITIGVEEPYFMDRRLAVGTELFYRDYSYFSDYYDQQNIGGRLYFRRPVFGSSERVFLEGEYVLQQVEIYDVSNDASDIIKSEEGKYTQNRFQLGLVRETRDELLVPRRGGRYSITGHVSAGGDVEAQGMDITGLQYFLLPYDFILSLQARGSTVWGDDVPIFERLFLGGANTLRGFDYRDVGPKDENGEPIGGKSSFFFSAEVTAPVIDAVRVAAFYDAGMVWEGSSDFGGSLNSNFGFGLRLFLPFGPLAVDYGIPISTDEFNDNSGRFNFNVGYKF